MYISYSEKKKNNSNKSWFMKSSFLLLDHKCLKPGSHMPPNYLRHSHRYCLGYCSVMRTYTAGNNNNHRRPLRRQACEVDLSSTPQARRRKRPALVLLPAAYVPISEQYPMQALPVAMSQVVRRHRKFCQGTRKWPSFLSNHSDG